MKTSHPKPATPQWFIVDAADQVLGRLSTRIANVIRGRHRPSFVPHQLCGDHVIVINADKVKVTGSKMQDKMYYRHTGYLGHLRSVSMEDTMKKNPTAIIENAVRGMLPKNLSRAHIMKKLHVFTGPTHEHDAHKPSPFPLS